MMIESSDFRIKTRLHTWALAMLLGAPWYGGLTASAQYSAPATPAPYNPIALAEVTGAREQLFKPDRITIKPFHRILTWEEFPGENSAQGQ